LNGVAEFNGFSQFDDGDIVALFHFVEWMDDRLSHGHGDFAGLFLVRVVGACHDVEAGVTRIQTMRSSDDDIALVFRVTHPDQGATATVPIPFPQGDDPRDGMWTSFESTHDTMGQSAILQRGSVDVIRHRSLTATARANVRGASNHVARVRVGVAWLLRCGRWLGWLGSGSIAIHDNQIVAGRIFAHDCFGCRCLSELVLHQFARFGRCDIVDGLAGKSLLVVLITDGDTDFFGFEPISTRSREAFVTFSNLFPCGTAHWDVFHVESTVVVFGAGLTTNRSR